MSDHYDQSETRNAAVRERDAFTALPQAITRAIAASGWAKQLAGVDPHRLESVIGISFDLEDSY